MIAREKYFEAKRLLTEINYELKTSSLTEQQRNELQLHAAKLAGALHSFWLPVTWSRRLIMIAIVLLGIQQAWWSGNYEPLIWWLLLPFFSPRIIGECAYWVGRFFCHFVALASNTRGKLSGNSRRG
jgi:hypothetical protein